MNNSRILTNLFRAIPFIILIVLISAAVVNARINGITGRTLKSGTAGCSCHGSSDPITTTILIGPSQVSAGQTVTYSLTVKNYTKTGAGLDVATRSGTLGVVSGPIQLLNSEIVHTSEIPMSSGSATVQFSYTAPLSLTNDTIFVTGNATNSSGTSSGDGWRFGTSFRVTVVNPFRTLSLRALIEAHYDIGTTNMILDTMIVELRNPSPPYSIVDQAKTLLDYRGMGLFNFSVAGNGRPYYIIAKHRNSIETWSSAPYQFVSDTLRYDFTTEASKAYGSNMKHLGTVWAIYSGDVNLDGTVDATDVSTIDNDAANFVGGYVATDLTGDSFVDATDFAIADNNAGSYVSVIRP